MHEPRARAGGRRSERTTATGNSATRVVTLLIIAFGAALACTDGPGSTAPERTVTLPLRVHVLSSRLDPFGATLSDAEVDALIGRVNEIWRQADIVWEVESVAREPAEAEDEAEAALLAGVPLTGAQVVAVLPRDRLLAGGWDAFIVRDLASAWGVPGVYFPFVPAVLSSEVDPAGRDDPGRILAHELGHSLTLVHVACTAAGNLMAPGCDSRTPTRLSISQIDQARRQARSGTPAP